MYYLRLAFIVCLPLFLSGCLNAQLLEEQDNVIAVAQDAQILWKANATLRPVEGNIGNGFAEASYQDNGIFVHTLRVNLLPIEEGAYVGWLMRDTPPTIVALGALRNEKGEGSYYLRSEHQADLRDHQKIVVTWEPEDDKDIAPSDSIIAGRLLIVRSEH